MSHFSIASPGTEVALQLGALGLLFAALALWLHIRGPRTLAATTVRVVFVLLALLQVAIYHGTTTSELRLTPGALAFNVPGFYGRSVGWDNIDFDGVRVSDLDMEGELQPKVRTNGIGLFGYRLGWHQLNNGRMAWLAVTDPTRVVVIPQYAGPTNIVSVDDPDGLVAQLRVVQELPDADEESASEDSAPAATTRDDATRKTVADPEQAP